MKETIEIGTHDLKEPTVENVADYVELEGTRCSFCGSADLAHDSMTVDGKLAFQEGWCTECAREWLDRYRLAGIMEG